MAATLRCLDLTDSNARGRLLVQEWLKRTVELREAQNEYESALNRAQDDRATNQSAQSWTFLRHGSDGHMVSAIRDYGRQMMRKKQKPRPRLNIVNPSSRHTKKK